MIYIDSEKRMSQVAADRATMLGLIQEILRAGTGREAGMTRDRRSQSTSSPVRVPAGTGSSAVGKVTLTLTQSLLEPAPTPERVEPGAPATADAPTVQRKLDHDASEPSASAAAPRSSYDLASLFGRPTGEPVVPVQRQASSPSGSAAVPQIAAQGVAGAGAALPHLAQIQASFGHHNVSGVHAHQGPAATAAARELGANAYAVGNSVAFAGTPDLHTTAHEAAHVVQQRGGVQLKGGIDQPGDAYERHADAVADAVVAGRPAAPLLDQVAGGGGNHDMAVQRSPAPAAATADVATQPGMWEHTFGEASTPVGKLGRVQAPKGVYLRERPLPGAASPSVPVPFNGLVFVERRTNQGTANQRWCYVIATEQGSAGFCEERYLAIDPPEPTATLHRTAPGERLATIAEQAYGPAKDDNNSRLYVQALYLANRDRAGVQLDHVDLNFKDRALRGEDERRTLEVYKGAKVIAGDSIWIPSKPFIEQLKAAGAVTGGSTLITEAWDAAKEAVGAVADVAKYIAGFFVGLLEGAYNAVVDLFKGAVDMVEAVLKIIWNIVTGNPGRVKEMASGWVEKMKAVWEHRGEIADEFLKKWNAENAWDRGQFQGEVLGWVTMTVLLILVTMGEDAPAALAGIAVRWPQLIKLLKTVDTLGDVTTYLGAAAKAAKLPGKAAKYVGGKFGRAARDAEHVAGDVERDARRGSDNAGKLAEHATEAAAKDAGKTERKASDLVTVAGYAQHPKLYPWLKNPDGAVRSIDEAVEIARSHGVVISDDILIRKVKGRMLPDNTYAQYFGRRDRDAQKMIRWEEFIDKDLDELVVRVSDSVFESDEAIVAILAHEMHELNELRRLFEESGGAMSMQRLYNLINPGIAKNLHDQAWDVADKLVLAMRKGAK